MIFVNNFIYICRKDSANRAENKISLLIFYPEMQPIL